MRGNAAQGDRQQDDRGQTQTNDKSKQHSFTPASFYPLGRRLISGRRFFIFLLFFILKETFLFNSKYRIQFLDFFISCMYNGFIFA